MRRPGSAEAARRADELDAAIEAAPPDLFERLRAGLQDEDPAVRATAAYGFSELVDPRAVPLLLRVVETDADEDAVHDALLTLSSYSDPAIRDLLLAQLGRPHKRLSRVAIARELGDYDDPGVIEALVGLLRDRDAFVSVAAHESLLHLRPDEAERWDRLHDGEG